MDLNRTHRSSARPMIALFLLLIMAVGAPLVASAAPSGDKSQPDKPNLAYNLQGDVDNNSGSSFTLFHVDSGTSGGAWRFFESHTDGIALSAQCTSGTSCQAGLNVGTAIGVQGTSTNNTNGLKSIGVYGLSGGKGGNNAGVYGELSDPSPGGNAAGVFGKADGFGYGVYGTAPIVAVKGVAISPNGSGVVGQTISIDGGSGVSGYAAGGNGVAGFTSGTTANDGAELEAGVLGVNSKTNGGTQWQNAGVYGACRLCQGVFGASESYIGVRGIITGSAATSYGGWFSNTDGVALYASSTNNTGILGNSTNGYGVYGQSSVKPGVVGFSANNYGVYGNTTTGTGVYGKSTTKYGVYAYTVSGTVALRATQPNAGAGNYAAVFDGDVQVNGDITCSGSCLAALSMPTDKGERLMYAEGATQSRLSDEGTAMLKDGRAVIKIDPLFAQTVNLSGAYTILLTPYSDKTGGLAAVNLTAGGFEVHELNGGKGSFSFAYRISAPRKGYESVRMAPAPSVPAPDKPAADPGK